MCELARALGVDENYYFSTWDLQEQCRKSYVTSYRVNEELVISRMFSRKLCQ